jgi:hypothetical protein
MRCEERASMTAGTDDAASVGDPRPQGPGGPQLGHAGEVFGVEADAQGDAREGLFHRQARADQGLGVGQGAGGHHRQFLGVRPAGFVRRAARGQHQAGLGVGLGQARADGGGRDQVALDRSRAGARLGEGGQRIHVEGQRRVGRGLGQAAQPVGGLGAQEAGVQGDGGEVQQHAAQRLGQVLRGADGDAVHAGRVEGQQHGGRAALQVLHDLGGGLARIGVGGAHAQVPGAVGVAGPQVARHGHAVLGRVERPDGDSVGSLGDERVVERLALQGLLDQGHPLGLGLGGPGDRNPRPAA